MEPAAPPVVNTSSEAREVLGALDSILTMPIVRLSGHAKKLSVVRAWVLSTDERLTRLEGQR